MTCLLTLDKTKEETGLTSLHSLKTDLPVSTAKSQVHADLTFTALGLGLRDDRFGRVPSLARREGVGGSGVLFSKHLNSLSINVTVSTLWPHFNMPLYMLQAAS